MKKAIKWFLSTVVPYLGAEALEEVIEFLQKKRDKLKEKQNVK